MTNLKAILHIGEYILIKQLPFEETMKDKAVYMLDFPEGQPVQITFVYQSNVGSYIAEIAYDEAIFNALLHNNWAQQLLPFRR